MTKRAKTIESVMGDLTALRGAPGINQYALEENIRLFKALRSRAGYIKWALRRAPNIDGARLLELSDFPLPQWQSVLQAELLNLERKRFDQLLGPLANAVVNKIKTRARDIEKPILVLNIGSGGMEIERRVIQRLRDEKFSGRVAFLALDNSESSIQAGRSNIKNEISAEYIGELSADMLTKAQGFARENQFSVTVCRGDAMQLKEYLGEGTVDIIFYSKLKHHIPPIDHARFASIVTSIADCVIEWDDYNGKYLFILPALFNWNQPILINAAVFSSLRDPDKKMLRRENPDWKTKIFPMTGYLKIYERVSAEKRLLNRIPGAKKMLHHVTHGAGQPVILLHGVNIGWGQWYPNIEALARHFTVYALDLPGASDFLMPSKNIDPEKHYVEMVEEFIRANHLEGAHLIGHSFGGWIAARIAQRQKVRIGKLILVNPLGLSVGVPAKFIPVTFRPIAKALTATVMKPNRQNLRKILSGLIGNVELPADFMEYYYESLMKQGNGAHPFLFINQLCIPFRMRPELELDDLTNISHETLLIGGDYDFLIKPAIIKKRASEMSHATVEIFENSGHVPAIEESERFNNLVITFLLMK